MLFFLEKHRFHRLFFCFFHPCRGVWSRGGGVCSDFGDCTTRSVAPHYKSSWSLCAGDSVVTPPKTQWAHHILPYIQVTQVYTPNTAHCVHNYRDKCLHYYQSLLFPVSTRWHRQFSSPYKDHHGFSAGTHNITWKWHNGFSSASCFSPWYNIMV